MELTSVVTCPHCGHSKAETMPQDACQFFYECTGCKTTPPPAPGALLRLLFLRVDSLSLGASRERARRLPGNMSAPSPQACARADLVTRRAGLLIWGIPLALLAIGTVWPWARAVLWVVAFAVAGAGCALNARRCGRTHCHFTGPLYLGLALASTLMGLGALDWGWHIVGIAAAVGTVIAVVPELIGPRYLRGSR